MWLLPINFSENVPCISQHPMFQSNCLDFWVIEYHAYDYVEDLRPLGDDELAHEYVSSLLCHLAKSRYKSKKNVSSISDKYFHSVTILPGK